MYFGTKSYLKSNRNHTAKHTFKDYNAGKIKFAKLKESKRKFGKTPT
jgi:hypothetical protein